MRSQLSGDQGRKCSDMRPFSLSMLTFCACRRPSRVRSSTKLPPRRLARTGQWPGTFFSGQRPTGQGTVSAKRNKLCRCSSHLTWFPMAARRQPTAVSTESLVWSPLMQRQRLTLREFQPSNQELGGRRTPPYPVPYKAPHTMVIIEATIQCMSARSQIFRGGRFSCPYVFIMLLHMYIGSPIAIKGALPFEVLRDAPSYDRATPSGQTESAKKPNGRGALSRCKTGSPQRHATRILTQRGQEAGRTAWTQSFIAPFTPCELCPEVN